ncbi:MAG TPA: prepilin-type N-terminal cleavage/methylation domain-containing protein [Pyrinomonadaceae bacterium]|nr:prepilin-type N-terminal cleavage/methylation domain-containing protein [Pyrinomonadaceae bacterium]
MQDKKHSSEAGFTLLETTVSMVLMAIIGLGIASLFAYAATNTSNTADREMASAVAQQRMEQLKSVVFTDSSLNATSSSGTSSTVTRLGRQYTVVTIITNSAGGTIKTITVKVTPVSSTAPNVNTIFASVTLVTKRSAMQMGSNRAL